MGPQQMWGVMWGFTQVPPIITPIHFVAMPTQSPHQLTLSLSHSHSLSTLSYTLKQERGREGEGKEGKIVATVAREGHGDHLQALIHKRLGFVEGGALSPTPQGAKRRRSQEQEDFESPRRRSSFSNFLESITSLFCSPWYDWNQSNPRISLSWAKT